MLLIFILKFQKIDVGIVYVFNVGIIRIILKFLFIRSEPFFFWNLWSQNSWIVFGFLYFSLNFHYFFHFFPNKNCQVKKIWNQKEILVANANPTI
jgi:uncharacterized membrane protein YkvI